MGRRAARAAVGTLAVVLLAGGGYVAADVHDRVPGLLTLAPPPVPPAPFPTAPGAVEPPAPTPVVAQLDPAAPVPDVAAVTALARELAGDARMGTSTGISVVDVLTGQVLADLEAGTPQVPASTAKVLTGFAALTALGAQATLPTAVVQPAPGRIVLVGGGDMMLAAGAGDPTATVGRAGLADLADATARALALAGVTTVSVAVDDTLFSGPTLHPDWVPSDVAAGYVAPVTAVAVDIAKTVHDDEYPPRHADPSLHAARTLADLLTARGVTVTGGVTREPAPAGSVELARVESAPLRDVVRYALRDSDNTITEVLGRLVAVRGGLPGSFDGATSAVLAEVAAQGLDTTGATLRDCSGLAATSALAPSLLTDALVLAADPDRPALLPALLDLPVGGWTGTLADRFGTGAAQGLVRAKTGSLPGVTSLAGTVLTVDGRLLAFAVLADATPAGGQAAPRGVIDTMVQGLAGCGCTTP